MTQKIYPDKFLIKEINQNYTTQVLRQSLQPLVFAFLRREKHLCMKEGVSQTVYNSLLKTQMGKPELIRACLAPFSNKTLFLAFRGFLPEKTRLILDELVWVEKLGEEEFKNKLGFSFVTLREGKTGQYQRSIEKEYSFFVVKKERGRGRWVHDYAISLPYNLRRHLIPFYTPPKEYQIGVVSLGKTQYTFNAEKDIFLELPRLIAYHNQGEIKLSKKNRLTISAINKIQRTLNLKEFYEDTNEKELKQVRTNAIASLIIKSNDSIYSKDYPLLVKKLFGLYRKKDLYKSMPSLLTTITGLGYLNNWNQKAVEKMFFDLLKEMPLGEWILFQNIENQIKYSSDAIEPVSHYVAQYKLYFNTSKGKKNIDKHLYYKGITQPLLKGSFFLFAAFGLIEIAYDAPKMGSLGKDYFSPYDELKFVKLTELGAYVIGKKKNYAQAPETQTTPLVLSEDSLMILSNETDLTADILLKNYSQKVGPNRYQTDYTIFLQGTHSEDDVKKKISLFQKIVSNQLPPNWKDFFDSLIKNMNSLADVSSQYSLLKIPPTNKKLIHLIAQDTELKRYVQKAEGFHILVKKSNLTKFKTRLKDFGFFLS